MAISQTSRVEINKFKKSLIKNDTNNFFLQVWNHRLHSNKEG